MWFFCFSFASFVDWQPFNRIIDNNFGKKITYTSKKVSAMKRVHSTANNKRYINELYVRHFLPSFCALPDYYRSKIKMVFLEYWHEWSAVKLKTMQYSDSRKLKRAFVWTDRAFHINKLIFIEFPFSKLFFFCVLKFSMSIANIITVYASLHSFLEVQSNQQSSVNGRKSFKLKMSGKWMFYVYELTKGWPQIRLSVETSKWIMHLFENSKCNVYEPSLWCIFNLLTE